MTRYDLIFLLLIILIVLIARALPGARTIDDAFITFRYSRNIIEGNGFVYNLGSRVMGTTTPLFTLIMAVIGGVLNGRDFPNYAVWVSALADAITACLLYLLMRRLTGSRAPALLIGLLWAVAPQSVTFAVGGMETSLNILWIVAAIYSFVTGRTAWVGVFAALGVLTRIDALIWIAPLFGWQFLIAIMGRATGVNKARAFLGRLPITTWLAFGVVLLPWLVFSYSYFGSIIPRSVTAKTAVYIMPPGSALSTILQNFGTPFFEELTFGGAGALYGALIYAVLYGIGSLYLIRREVRLLPWLIYPVLYALAFGVANPLIFRWYVAPPLPSLFFGILAGVWAILSTIRARPQTRLIIQRVGVGLVGALWLFTSMHAWTIHPDHGNDRPAPQMAWHLVEVYYRDMANDLITKYQVNRGTKIAVADIGVIGYFTDAVIIDTVGLISPSMSRYYPADPSLIITGQNYGVPPAIIRDTTPEYLVMMEAAVRNGLERDPDFKASYELVRTIPTDFYGTGMLLYKRR